MPETDDASAAGTAPQGAPAPAGVALCAADALEDRGLAHVFDLLEYGRPVRGFVLRFDGRVVGYLNRCQHVPTEMDWQEGHFLDSAREWILCSIHGAAYDPADGRCVGGPCGRGRLTALQVEERDGQVYWYPSRDLQPLSFDEARAAAGGLDASPGAG
jgi:nitrite reductase/ring-hydroxylating ferredoxin subunit